MADVSWRAVFNSKNPYGKNGRQGRKFAGNSHTNEIRASLIATSRRISKWKKFFELKHGRPASDEEVWAAIKDESILSDLAKWTSEELIPNENAKEEKRRISRSQYRQRRILRDWVKKHGRPSRDDLLVQSAYEAEINIGVSIFISRLQAEVPQHVIRNADTDAKRDAICLFYSITHERFAELRGLFGCE